MYWRKHNGIVGGEEEMFNGERPVAGMDCWVWREE